VTESFFNATMSDSQLRKHNNRLVLFSGSFLLIAFGLSKLFGIYGFLLANCANMCIRIWHSSIHIRLIFAGFTYQIERFQGDQIEYNVLKCFLPDQLVLISLLVSLLITQISQIYLYNSYKLLHLFNGALCFLFSLFIIYKKEINLKSFILKFIRKRPVLKKN
jgi:oligosaccharide translocation protein RFT1